MSERTSYLLLLPDPLRFCRIARRSCRQRLYSSFTVSRACRSSDSSSSLIASL